MSVVCRVVAGSPLGCGLGGPCGFLRTPLLGTRSGLCPSFVARSRRALWVVASVARAGFCARPCWARALVCVRRLSGGRGEPFGLWPRWPMRVFARAFAGHALWFVSVVCRAVAASPLGCGLGGPCRFLRASLGVMGLGSGTFQDLRLCRQCRARAALSVVFRTTFHAIPSHSAIFSMLFQAIPRPLRVQLVLLFMWCPAIFHAILGYSQTLEGASCVAVYMLCHDIRYYSKAIPRGVAASCYTSVILLDGFCALGAIPSYSKLLQSIPSYSKLLQAIPNCSKLFQAIPSYSELFQVVPSCSQVFSAIQSYSRSFLAIPCYSKLPQAEPSCSKLFQAIPSYSKLFQASQTIPSRLKLSQANITGRWCG